LIPVWSLGLRPAPKIDLGDAKNIFVIAFLHAVGHFGAVVSMSLGAVSFTHIVKAAEPVFSTVLTGLLLGKWAPWQVNATLIPVIFGVILASVQLSFSPLRIALGDFNIQAFSGAMISNLAFALRSIYMKRMDDTPEKKAACKRKNLTSDNVYAIYTIFAFLIAIPVTYVFEGASVRAAWEVILKSQRFQLPALSTTVLQGTPYMVNIEMHIVTGLFFYLYNEASSLALGNLDGVAHAVCNTVKRVVIMIAMSFFDKPLNAQKWTGATIAIGGTLLYTLVKTSFDSKAVPKKKIH